MNIRKILPPLRDLRNQLDGLERVCQDFSIGMPDLINLMIVYELSQMRELLEKMDKNTSSDRTTDKPKGISEVT